MIQKHLQELAEQYKIKVTYLTETPSTNDVVRDPVYKEADMVIAETQTKGRGQRGNHWESEKGKNLTFSIVLSPAFLAAQSQFMLSETISLALVDTLAHFGVEAQIKWPNDIYVDGRKIAGILIENDIMGDRLSRSIVGIGLNVNQRDFSPELPNPTSMSLVTGTEIDRGAVLKYFYVRLSIRYAALVGEYMSSIQNDYHERLLYFEMPHTFKIPDSTTVFTGTIRRVEPSGTLIVEREDGTLKGYLFKEIEF